MRREHLAVARVDENLLNAFLVLKPEVEGPFVGGGGGGRDNMAQAGGRDPDKLPDALKTAERAIREVLA